MDRSLFLCVDVPSTIYATGGFTVGVLELTPTVVKRIDRHLKLAASTHNRGSKPHRHRYSFSGVKYPASCVPLNKKPDLLGRHGEDIFDNIVNRGYAVTEDVFIRDHRVLGARDDTINVGASRFAFTCRPKDGDMEVTSASLDLNGWRRIHALLKPVPAGKVVDYIKQKLDLISSDDFDMGRRDAPAEGNQRLPKLIDALLASDDSDATVEFLFRFTERVFPVWGDPFYEIDYPGPIIHAIEKRGRYEGMLRESLHRLPTMHTISMLQRLLGITTDMVRKEELTNVLIKASRNSAANEYTRNLAMRALGRRC